MVRPADPEWHAIREKIYDAIVEGFLEHNKQSEEARKNIDLNICGHNLPLTYILRLGERTVLTKETLSKNKAKYMNNLADATPAEEDRNLLLAALDENGKCAGYIIANERTEDGKELADIDLVCSFSGIGGGLFKYLTDHLGDKDEVRLNAVMTVLYFYNNRQFKFGDACDTPHVVPDKKLQITDRYWHSAVQTKQLPAELYRKLKAFYDEGILYTLDTPSCNKMKTFDKVYDSGRCFEGVKMIWCPKHKNWKVPAP